MELTPNQQFAAIRMAAMLGLEHLHLIDKATHSPYEVFARNDCADPLCQKHITLDLIDADGLKVGELTPQILGQFSPITPQWALDVVDRFHRAKIQQLVTDHQQGNTNGLSCIHDALVSDYVPTVGDIVSFADPDPMYVSASLFLVVQRIPPPATPEPTQRRKDVLLMSLTPQPASDRFNTFNSHLLRKTGHYTDLGLTPAQFEKFLDRMFYIYEQ